jgi:hypothetical protein
MDMCFENILFVWSFFRKKNSQAQLSWLSPPEYLEIISSFYPTSTTYDENIPSSSLEWGSTMGIVMASKGLSSPPTSGTLIVYDKVN